MDILKMLAPTEEEIIEGLRARRDREIYIEKKRAALLEERRQEDVARRLFTENKNRAKAQKEPR